MPSYLGGHLLNIPTFSPVIEEKKTKVGDFYVVTYRL